MNIQGEQSSNIHPSPAISSPKTEPNDVCKDNKRFICPLCPETFTKKANVRRHIQRKHKGNPIDVEGGKTLCLECGAKFHRVVDLKSHLSKEHQMIFRNELVTFGTRKGIQF